MLLILAIELWECAFIGQRLPVIIGDFSIRCAVVTTDGHWSAEIIRPWADIVIGWKVSVSVGMHIGRFLHFEMSC